MVSYYQDVVNALHDHTDTSFGAGPTAMSVTEAATFITTSAAAAITLAGAQVGQLKFICLKSNAGGAATITVSTGNGWNTLVMADDGDWVILRWNGLSWDIKASRGVSATTV
jgi:hypothetical protein